MQDSTLTDDDVRERFSAYHDRELSPAEHEAVRLAIEARAVLQDEYKGFCQMMERLNGLGLGGITAPGVSQGLSPDVPRVDLLGGIHRKLHRRSGGKLFGDAWSRTTGIFPLEVIAAVVLVGMILAYVSLTWVSTRPVDHPVGDVPSPVGPSR